MSKPTILVLLILYILSGCSEPTDSSNNMTLNQLLAGENTQNFSRADKVRNFQFPQDHGPHPRFRNEWWYLTGNISDEQNIRYGYQLTFFRRALKPDSEINKGWQDKNIYMAHFALSNHQTGEFIAREKFGRNGAQLAGAQARPFRVWLDDWQISSTGSDFFPLKLSAKNERYQIELELNSNKPLILQGDQGLSQKSAELGNASYYYSYTRLQTSGFIKHGQQQYTVQGSSWLDREWSTSALSENQQGWDWFALQLSSGEELMFYRLRQRDGSDSPQSSGVIVTKEGQKISLDNSHITLTATQHWQQKQHRYPVKWRMQIDHPLFTADWIISTPIKNQFLNLSVPYWEGAVDVSDPSNGQGLGVGFVELTGY